LYGIVDNLTEDRAQLKFLVLLRNLNTCKHLKEHIPRVYTLHCRLDKLQSEVVEENHWTILATAPVPTAKKKKK
jgi:hypothetical protein